MTFATVYIFTYLKSSGLKKRTRPRDDLISITVNNVLLNFGNKQTKKHYFWFTIQKTLILVRNLLVA